MCLIRSHGYFFTMSYSHSQVLVDCQVAIEYHVSWNIQIFLKNISNVIYARNVVCWIVLISYKLQLFDCLLQLKSSLQLHIDGTSPVAEDIGRQVMIFSFSGSVFVQSFYFKRFYISFLDVFLLSCVCRYLHMSIESLLLNFLWG